MSSLDILLRETLRGAMVDAVRPIIQEEFERFRQEFTRQPSAVLDDEMLTTAKAARLLSVTPDTIREWIDDGRLTAHGTRRALRVSRRELLALRPDQGGAEVVDIERRAREILDRPRSRR